MYYGTGALGSVTISTNTTLTGREFHYNNLTINSGASLSIPDKSFLFVTGTLALNGTIRVIGAAGGVGGTINANSYAGNGGAGGGAGGAALIHAATITGSGLINASGDNGATGAPNGSLNQSSQNYGNVQGGVGYPVLSPMFKSNGQKAVSGTSNGIPTTPSAYYGIADDLISYNSVQYGTLLNDYFFSGHSKFPLLISAGSGSGGTSGSAYNSDNGDGGSGGAGGTSFGAGGKQGKGNNASSYYNFEGSGGGGGGGGGGFVLLGSENITCSISVNTDGGNGGAGGYNSTSPGCPGGPGGGGGGGAVYVIANKMVSATANGGNPGTFTVGSGYSATYATAAEAGRQGIVNFVSVDLFK